MKDALQKLLVDFLSPIGFLAVYAATGSVTAATLIAVGVAVAQFVHARMSGRPLSIMTGASVALAVVLGAATLMTDDPRFVLIKPSIVHFAIGAIMLRRGWLLRYMPPIVAQTIPVAVTRLGYAWAALMFALGVGVIAVALTGDLWLWGLYVSVVAIGAKLVMFAAGYAIIRILMRRRLGKPPSPAVASAS